MYNFTTRKGHVYRCSLVNKSVHFFRQSDTFFNIHTPIRLIFELVADTDAEDRSYFIGTIFTVNSTYKCRILCDSFDSVG